MVNFKDITGNRYGKLIVVEYVGGTKWYCECDCGCSTIVLGNDLRRGRTKSCGCRMKSRKGRGYTVGGTTIESILWNNAFAAAKKKGLPFNLELEDIIVPEYCPVLQIPIFKAGDKRTDNSPSLDKLIPELGYVKGNVNVISWKANRIKNDANYEELYLIADWLYNQQKGF